jgi:hypothetical protein
MILPNYARFSTFRCTWLPRIPYKEFIRRQPAAASVAQPVRSSAEPTIPSRSTSLLNCATSSRFYRTEIWWEQMRKIRITPMSFFFSVSSQCARAIPRP